MKYRLANWSLDEQWRYSKGSGIRWRSKIIVFGFFPSAITCETNENSEEEKGREEKHPCCQLKLNELFIYLSCNHCGDPRKTALNTMTALLLLLFPLQIFKNHGSLQVTSQIRCKICPLCTVRKCSLQHQPLSTFARVISPNLWMNQNCALELTCTQFGKVPSTEMMMI